MRGDKCRENCSELDFQGFVALNSHCNFSTHLRSLPIKLAQSATIEVNFSRTCHQDLAVLLGGSTISASVKVGVPRPSCNASGAMRGQAPLI